MLDTDNRPINRNPLSIRLPITAIVSILHRVSGVVLFLALPILLFLFHHSVKSTLSFIEVKEWLQQTPTRVLFSMILAALVYHLVAGIRHLLMDLGWGEERRSGCIGAYLVLLISALLFAGLELLLW